jgi:Na+-driven multidrug efflux pump
MDMTVRGFLIYSLSFLLCGFNIFGSSMFTALNNGLVSAVISFVRTLICQIAAVLILPVFFELDGIWFSVVAAELTALVLTVLCLIKFRKRYHYV